MTIYPDPALLHPSSITPEIHQRNAQIAKAMAALPEWWVIGPPAFRKNQREGAGVFPPVIFSERATTRTIESEAGPLRLREFLPSTGKPRGVYLHLHGGGWVIGGADMQDSMLLTLADHAQVAVLSVHYRLAPEHRYPAAPDDCETAALWLLDHCAAIYGAEQLIIGGESAGSHLSAVTLLRLRQRLGFCPFSGANFNFGLFDMTLTPSARAFGDERLFLRTIDMLQFRDAFLPGEHDLRDPDISPLYGDLQNLCPALFTIGTRDALLDDSLFMHARWLAAGNTGQLDVYPGAPHAFFRLADAHTQSAMTQQIQFICSLLK
ncbi:alpha/beta hydrolase [Limnohabitans sp. Rim8]|uniref:alpha/beta hydrolase n=1 Tax=Limnohabitans sp. Rim8 TaxID=1100718 RepID=UPI0026237986|nr:alpha/beta hydrolase [Limnohabitans sp. Rim8]